MVSVQAQLKLAMGNVGSEAFFPSCLGDDLQVIPLKFC